MIKFCIALALLATISLSTTTYCATNVILATDASCYCQASGTPASPSKKIATDNARHPNANYCQKGSAANSHTVVEWTDYSQCTTDWTTETAISGTPVNTIYGGSTCKIDAGTDAGNKICVSDEVYKSSADADECPIKPADSPLCANLDAFKLTTSTAVNDKYKGALCTLKLASGSTATTVCPPDTVYKASITSCPLIPAACTTEQKTKKFATVIGGDGCQCETDKFCAAAKYCYDGACNDAAKLCSVWPAAECDGLDRTASTCLDTGCDKVTCCEAFKSSAFTMGVQTAVIVGLMTFM